jgi:hypothetical protein
MKKLKAKSKKELEKINKIINDGKPLDPKWKKLGELIAEELNFRIAHARSPIWWR